MEYTQGDLKMGGSKEQEDFDEEKPDRVLNGRQA